MTTVIVTGAAGLIGSEAARFFSRKGYDVVGIDNDMRRSFFGPEASTRATRDRLAGELSNYTHYDCDIRDLTAMERVFAEHGADVGLIVHTAAQPSHDWAAKDPQTDFSVNANGTLNLLECTRHRCPEAVFIFTSTNKVYGDRPNSLPLVERELRWEVAEDHPYFRHGIDEQMSIDQSKHSVFGASKVAADVLVQEYGRYFGMKTGCFRGGCLTGPAHAGVPLHGFLAYLMKVAVSGGKYSIFGYKGKQVRDNIHASDLINAFWHFFQNPRPGEVYNIGGARPQSCSVLEAIQLCEDLVGARMNYEYVPDNRSGDHIWWISDVRKFQGHFPDWHFQYDLRRTLTEIRDAAAAGLSSPRIGLNAAE